MVNSVVIETSSGNCNNYLSSSGQYRHSDIISLRGKPLKYGAAWLGQHEGVWLGQGQLIFRLFKSQLYVAPQIVDCQIVSEILCVLGNTGESCLNTLHRVVSRKEKVDRSSWPHP